MSKPKHNAAVYLISSRRTDLQTCLALFFQNWNRQFNYPVYVHHFGNIYSAEFVQQIKNDVSQNIFFKQIDFGVPPHIPEKDLFYNRSYLEYVRKCFPPSRIGYLHVEYFTSHILSFGQKGCLSHELSSFDYLMRIDDDSWFNKPIDFDLFDFALDSPVVTAYTWRHETWRNDQTTEGLWQFYLKYLRDAGIDVSAIRNDSLRKAAITYNGQESFPTSIDISCGNCNIYNLSLFKASRFADWIEAVDLYGGQYKHRWGDIEVIALFTATEFDRPICDLNLVAQGLYEPQLPGTTFAPSISMTKAGPVVFVRNALRACIFYPPRFFHKFFIPLFFRGISKARALARLFLGKS